VKAPLFDATMALATTVYQEAEGESLLGKLAVAHVIVNRVKRANQGRVNLKTVHDIVFAPFQFSCWNTDSPTRPRLGHVFGPAWEESWVAAEQALAGDQPDPTKGATHYLNPGLTRKIRKDGTLPSWYDERKVTLREGAHHFLRL